MNWIVCSLDSTVCSVKFGVLGRMGRPHWCFKSIKSGFAIAIVACLKNLDVLKVRIDAQKLTHDTLQDTKKNERPEAYSGLQTFMVTRSI